MREPRLDGVTVFRAGSAGWEQARTLFDASLDRRPGKVYQPNNRTAAVLLLSHLHETGTEFTVRGGGHSAAGLSIRDNASLVDLSLLRNVWIDPIRRTAIAEGGALIADLDEATTRYDLATTGGTVSHTGLTGLALGGGLGWLMGRFGLTCDNILEASVVTSSGPMTVMVDSELMRILRGAGRSLGTVTALTLRLHPIEPLFTWLSVSVPPEQEAAFFSAFNTMIDTLPDEVGCALTIGGTRAGTCRVELDVVGPHDRPDEWLVRAPVRDFPRRSRVMPYRTVQRSLDLDFPFGQRSYRRSLCVDEVAPEYLESLVGELRLPSRFTRSVTFDILHGSASSPLNAAASSFRRHRYVGLLVARWSEPRWDDLGRQAGRSMFKHIESAHARFATAAYGNYSSEPSDDG